MMARGLGLDAREQLSRMMAISREDRLAMHGLKVGPQQSLVKPRLAAPPLRLTPRE
jgi:hypothetical protein